MKPYVTILTLTGDRPDTFELCQRYVERQTYDGPIQWLVIDDGYQDTKVPSWCDYHKRQIIGASPRVTISNQIQYAMSYVAGDVVVFMEDDDWYARHHVESMVAQLHRSVVCGPKKIFYYHVPGRKYFVSQLKSSTAFCQTAFRRGAIQKMHDIAREYSDVELLDRIFWFSIKLHLKNLFDTNVNFPGDVTCIGMKGLPGRKSATKHNLHSRYTGDDQDEYVLRNYIGDDIDHYRPWLGMQSA